MSSRCVVLVRVAELPVDALRGPLHEHDVSLEPRRIASDTGVRRRRPLDPAGREVDLPRMERTHDCGAAEDAIAERAAFVRAAVVHGEEPIAEVEDRDLAIAEPRLAPLTQRDVAAIGHTHPAAVTHTGTFSMA